MNRDTPQSNDGNQESGGALKAWQWWHPPTNAGNRPDIQAPNQGSTETGRILIPPPKRVGRAVGRVPPRGGVMGCAGWGHPAFNHSRRFGTSGRPGPVLNRGRFRDAPPKSRNVAYQIFARCSIDRYIGVPSRIPKAS